MFKTEYLESFIISDEEIATEGYNLDTKDVIKNNAKRTEIIALRKSIGKQVRAGIKAKDPNILKAALRDIDKAYKLIYSFKDEIAQLDEPENMKERAAGWFTPIFDFWLPKVEVQQYGNVTVMTQYTDSMSKDTKSSVKKSYQLRMNNLLHYLSEYKKIINRKIRKYEKKQANK